ncbi:MAG: hypothetical protein QGH25_14950, partial [Candidatus Latescibacteria bacterium]|nr:hypothetical protein [Candidatus Latescibacterota bacterium]
RDYPMEILSGTGEIPASMVEWLRVLEPDLLINDLLDTAHDYMAAVGSGRRVLNFDDNGPGRHLATGTINALPCKMRMRDAGLNTFQGPDYLLLGEEFAQQAPARALSQVPSSMLITLGGSDTYGNTVSAVSAVRRLRGIQHIDVIVGPAFAHQATLTQEIAGDGRFKVHIAVPSLADLMRRHEFALVGGGISLFEAGACGLPTMAVASEDFERENILWAQERGLTRLAGGGQPASADEIYEVALELLNDPQARADMAAQGPLVVDGKGKDRVVGIVSGLCN